MNQPGAASHDALIVIKVAIDGTNRRFRLPLRDLVAPIFESRIRTLLQIPTNQELRLERFSDSSGSFVSLDAQHPTSYKQLYRAGRAKLKLRLRATALPVAEEATVPVQNAASTSAGPAPEIPAKNAQTTQAVKPTLPPLSAILENYTKVCAYDAGCNIGSSVTASSGPLPIHTKQPPAPFWQVCCNKCDTQVTDAHFHCSICDGGDYDLCETCVKAGAMCPGENHWLIKRTVKNGNFVSSVTETIAPKAASKPASASKAVDATSSETIPSIPGSFKSAIRAPERICNVCIRHLPEDTMITCQDCADYDMCMPCLVENKHGHHPGHAFRAIGKAGLSADLARLCSAGRNASHQTICDNCDVKITGVRHKCLDCPDFDFCSDCLAKKASHGSNHRFIPVFEPISFAPTIPTRHMGIYCDGPLCTGKRNQAYIQGVRYKCAVCHDVDFCEGCEAHPNNEHSITHPLIKFKTMVKDVSVETLDSQPNGTVKSLGDRRCSVQSKPSASTLPRYTPYIPPPPPPPPGYSAFAPTLAKLPVPRVPPPPPSSLSPTDSPPAPVTVPTSALLAEFVKDTMADGSEIEEGQMFQQTWTLNNPGPHAWPTGCSVRHTGGDYMLNVDQNRPGSVAELAFAQQTNVTAVPVPPQHAQHFTVTMKAPTKPGKYISYWRLKGPDGAAFGHKVWCDITVVKKFVPPPPPPPPQAAVSPPQQPPRPSEAQIKEAKADADRDVAVWKRHLGHEEFSDTVEHIEDIALYNAKKTNEQSGSVMVFPKLEKESPGSSTHQDASTSTASPEAVVSPTAPTVTEAESNVDDKNEVESVASFSDSDEDDGFMTDEEYDILDASDEEIINGGNQ